MNKSYSKIRHIQEVNQRLENKLILEKAGDSNRIKVNNTKYFAQIFNMLYQLNLPAAQTGNWKDKDFNDVLKKYLEEKQIPVWICKTGDGYCPDGSDGEVTAKFPSYKDILLLNDYDYQLPEYSGNSFTSETAGSLKAKDTKFVAQFLNSRYKINLPAAQTGNWHDKDYNDNLKKYIEELKIPVWICKTGDGYCPDGSDGEVTAYGKDNIGKLYDSMRKPNKTTEQGKINTTFDKAYDYKLENGKYYFKGKENTQYAKNYPNWVEATGKGLEAIRSKVTFA